MANPPITIGPFNNVPAPGSPIRSDFAQSIATYVTNNVGRKDVTATQKFNGNIVSGNDDVVSPGTIIRTDGAITSYISGATGATILTNSLNLARGGTPGGVGGQFIRFSRGATDTGGNGTPIGSVTVATGGSSVNYNTTSDRRLKEDRGLITDALARLLELVPRRFVWLTDPTDREQDGFFADEVQAVVPEAVTGEPGAVMPDDDPYTPGAILPQQLDRAALVPLLVAAVQELAGRVAELEGAS